ncbi:MAG: hypothetical protein D6741_20235, partial [Planctomycetota bacterium]
WKAATIGSRFLEAYEKKKERLALLDTAPIISVAIRTEADCRVIHHLPVDETQVAGAALERTDDQEAMLRRVRDYLDQCTPDTVLIGHNIRHFDLPKLRHAMLRHGIRLPQCLVDRDQPLFDTMIEWNRYTLDERPMVSLCEVLDACGLPNHKQLIDGAFVPDLYEQGEHLAILTYAVVDVVAEWTLFLRMTGQEGDRPLPAKPPVMDNSPGNPTPICPAATIAGRIDLPAKGAASAAGNDDVDRLIEEFQS